MRFSIQESKENWERLRRLSRAIEFSSGRLPVILVRCNYRELRSQLIEVLREEFSVVTETLVLSPDAPNLYDTVRSARKDGDTLSDGDTVPAAVNVVGFGNLEDLDQFLATTNRIRDRFNASLQSPLILWLNDEAVQKMVKLAPDFYNSVQSPIPFQPSFSELQQFLQQQSKIFLVELFQADIAQLPMLRSCVQLCSVDQREIHAALRTLEESEHSLEPELTGCLKFAMALDEYLHGQLDSALANCASSNELWKNTPQLEKLALLHFHWGRCYQRKVEQERGTDPRDWQAAQEHFQRCLSLLEQAERPDLQAKWISYCGEPFRALGAWDALEALTEQALVLRQTFEEPVERARDRGFQSEIAFQKQQYEMARQYAEEALEMLARASAVQREMHQSAYLLLLARALWAGDELEQAMVRLEDARSETCLKRNPRLYLEILEELRAGYFEQKAYLEAFQVRQERRSIESQYGWRAFVGAARLRPRYEVKRAGEVEETVASEIEVSGRQKNINELIDRVKRRDSKITILHGQLGVGKSSLVQAGLVPCLHETLIDAQEPIVVLVRSYKDWPQTIGQALELQLSAKNIDVSSDLLMSHDGLLSKLRQSEDRQISTVLIFDQFEEFFFAHCDRTSQEKFFQFIYSCLIGGEESEIGFLNLIFSIREDYLHLLLKLESYIQHRAEQEDRKTFHSIGRDLLSRENRYELRNFSVHDAQAIIKKLTDHSPLELEANFVEQLVQDLAAEAQEIRPIELQVVGAQLQTEEIRTLGQYRQLGDRPKERLVRSYLEGIVKDCGPENEETARLILYLLTDSNYTRPSKTRAELAHELGTEQGILLGRADKLDLVLKIFRESGLVFLLPSEPSERYQLVHDYLVNFIRQQQPGIRALAQKLEDAKKKLIEAKLKIINSELEREKSEERRKRESAEKQQELAEKEKKLIEVRAKQRTTKLVSTLVITTAIFSLAYFREQTRIHAKSYLKGIDVQAGRVIDIRQMITNQLIENDGSNADELALILAIDAMTDITSGYSDYIRNRNELNETLALAVSATKNIFEKYSIPIPKDAQEILSLDVGRPSMSLEELKTSLEELKILSCQAIHSAPDIRESLGGQIPKACQNS